MMKMEVRRGIEKYVLQIEPITQICGTNYVLKNYLSNSIYKHFSSSKYSSFEEEMIENVNINGECIGKEYFDVIQINTREELIDNITMSKNSLMQEYTCEILKEYDCQKDIELLKDDLDRILISLNKEFKINGVEIDFEMNDIFKLVSKSTIVVSNGKCPEEMPNGDLVNIFLDIFTGLQRIKPTKKLVIFNNIDMLINLDEYMQIVSKAKCETQKSDTWFMFFVGKDNYLFLDEEFFEGINVINSEIFSMPEYDKILDFFISEYPRNIDKKHAEEIVQVLPQIVNKIGDANFNINLVAIVALKIINESLGIKIINEEKEHRLEKEYLNI